MSSVSCAARPNLSGIELADRALLAALSRVLPRERLVGLRDHARDAASLASRDRQAPLDLRSPRPREASARRRACRPDPAPRAREPALCHRRIVGELKKLGLSASETSVRNLLRHHGVPPVPRRCGLSRRAFPRQQAASLIACYFFTVDTIRSECLDWLLISSRRQLERVLCIGQPPRLPPNRL